MRTRKNARKDGFGIDWGKCINWDAVDKALKDGTLQKALRDVEEEEKKPNTCPSKCPDFRKNYIGW